MVLPSSYQFANGITTYRLYAIEGETGGEAVWKIRQRENRAQKNGVAVLLPHPNTHTSRGKERKLACHCGDSQISPILSADYIEFRCQAEAIISESFSLALMQVKVGCFVGFLLKRLVFPCSD